LEVMTTVKLGDHHREILGEILDHSLEAAFLTRPDGTILYANPAACAMFGYSLREFQSLGRGAVVDPSDPALHSALEQRSLTGHFQGVLRLKCKDGSRLLCELSSAVYSLVGGEQRTSMFIRDVTERELRQEELKRANEELKRALDEVQKLRGLLPICCYCKRIRDDGDYWQSVETYIFSRAPVTFSHGICPQCYGEKVQPQLDQLKKTNLRNGSEARSDPIQERRRW